MLANASSTSSIARITSATAPAGTASNAPTTSWSAPAYARRASTPSRKNTAEDSAYPMPVPSAAARGERENRE
jgi:hypothetical protein